MNRYFIDANIFLRVLVKIKVDKKTFDECILFLNAVKTNKVQAVTSSVILAEVAWTLRSFYALSRTQIAEALDSIINFRGLQISDNYNHKKAISIYKQKNIKYIDALISSIEEVDKKEWVIVSYDRDFDKLRVIRKEPGEIK